MDYKKLLLKGIKIGVILTLFTPLVMGPFGLSFSNYPKAVFFRALVQIIFIFYLLLILLAPRYLPKFSILVLAVSVYIGILFLAGLAGFNFNRSFFGDLHRAEGIILHLHLLVFFLILASVFNQRKDWILFFKLSVIVSAFSSLAGILQKLQLAKFYGVNLPDRISGTWTNPDFFASYLVLVIFLTIYLLLVEKNRNWKIFLVCILALNCFTLILSQTRAAWLGLIFGAFFLFFIWFFRASALEAKKRKLILFATLFFCLFLLLLVLNQDYFFSEKNLLFQRALSIFDLETLYQSARFPVWQTALEAWKEKPILGWGPESFNYVFEKYFKSEHLRYFSENIRFDRPHNKISEILAGAGIVGLLSYFAIFSAVFYLLWKIRKTEPIIAFVFSAFFISYFAANFFSFDTLGTYLLFFLVLGFINNSMGSFFNSSLSAKETGLPADKKFLKFILVFSLILLSLISFYQLNFKPTIASRLFIKAADERDFEKAVLNYQQGINKKTFYDNDFRRELASHLVFVLENSQPAKEIEKEIVEILAGLKPFLEKNLEAPENNLFGMYELVARINERIYLLEKNWEALEEMEKIINQALAFNNQKPEFYRLLGKKEMLQGNFSQGEFYFKKSFEMGPKTFEDKIYFYKTLGAAYLKAGDKKMAAENFKKVLDIDFILHKFKEIPFTKTESEAREKEIQIVVALAQYLAWFYYQELDDLEAGRQIYEKAIEIFPQYEEQLRINLEMMTQ